MEFYLLKMIRDVRCDEVCEFLVEADSAEVAREIAATRAADEGLSTWLSPELSTCESLKLHHEPRIVIRNLCSGW